MASAVCQRSLSSIKIPYSVDPDSLGTYVYTAKMKVQLALTTPLAPRTKRIEMIIDSGASRCLFDWSIAEFLGVKRANCVLQVTTGIGGNEDTFLHDVLLFIPGGAITIKAAFKENMPLPGLLGMNGFFEHFRITFDSQAKECQLERIYHS